jgi:hypothetical protein
MTAKLPGFLAEGSLVHMAQDQPCRTDPTSRACIDCWAECIAGCEPDVRQCFPMCRAECGGQPHDPGSIGCTPRDNSANNFACNAGITAWQLSAKAICAVLTGPFAGPCSSAVDSLAADMRSSCPPPVICA